MTSHNEAPANANEISNNLAEAQKTNEEIVEEFRERFPQFRGVGAPYPMFDETPVYTHVIQFIEYALTLKDEAHKKEMEEAVKAERERVREQLKNIPSGEDVKISGIRMNAAGASGWDALRYSLIQNFDTYLSLTPTKEVTEELTD